MQEYKDHINYCGPAGRFSLPRRYFGVDINYSCYLHDRAYIYGNDRKEADSNLRKNVLKDFKNAGKPVLGYLVSGLIWAAVRVAGKLSKHK